MVVGLLLRSRPSYLSGTHKVVVVVGNPAIGNHRLSLGLAVFVSSKSQNAANSTYVDSTMQFRGLSSTVSAVKMPLVKQQPSEQPG